MKSVIRYRSYLLLFTVYCSLFTVFYGCASAKKSELPNVQIEAIEYNQRGVNAVLAGNYDRAVIEFQRSLKLNTSIDNQNGVCINLLNLGRVYLAADRFDDARPVLERALQLGLNNLNDQLMLSEAYASLARYYYLTGNNNDAIDVSEKAAAIDRKQGYHTIGNRLNIMGLAYKESNRPEEAEKAFNEALALSKGYARPADTADSFRGLGDIWIERGDYQKAGELYENALSIDKKMGDSAKISIDLSNLGALNLKINDTKKALDFFIRAYEIDSSRGDDILFFSGALKNLDKITEIYTRLGDKEGAAAYSLEKEKLLKHVPEGLNRGKGRIKER